MTRLSDSLRGLADRAPVGEVVVSTSAATRRIHRARRLRGAANATAGVGVAAVIALAAINPGAGSSPSMADAGALDASQEGAKAAAPEGFDASGASELAWGQCGTRPFDVDYADPAAVFSLALSEIGDEAESGGTVDATLTVTLPTDSDASGYSSTGPSYMVLWDGVVVGVTQDTTLDPAVQSTEDGTAIWTSPVGLVNCWDGTPLPGGAYELVAYQDFTPLGSEVVPPTEPTTTPVEPSMAPVDPTTATDSPVTADGGASTESGVTSGNTGVVGPAADAATRSVSNPVKFVIAGDVPDDPFGAYLSPAAPAVVYPDDYLTPAAAREEYAARAASGTWDMAAGTQRVIKSGDSTAVDDPNVWLDSYYGCSADGSTSPTFPSTSADWPLLGVEANLPGSLGVSYGWVVDGNPEVTLTVTNTSGHTLPGFWGQPSSSIYLVRDGKVVAMSYLAPTDPNGNMTTQSTDGLLAPDGTLSGTYLWRDVNGCWMGDAQAKVTPGTYTVLTEQDVYLDNGNGGIGGPIAYLGGKNAVDDGTVGVDATGAPAIAERSAVNPEAATADAPSIVAPGPGTGDGTYDWVSLQVWTSLGQVKVK